MGYETNYSVDTRPADRYDEVKAAINKISEYGDHTFSERLSWYDHEEHCLEVSTQFPGVWVILSGVGEENFDKWRKVFRNGNLVDAWYAEEPEPPALEYIKDGDAYCV